MDDALTCTGTWLTALWMGPGWVVLSMNPVEPQFVPGLISIGPPTPAWMEYIEWNLVIVHVPAGGTRHFRVSFGQEDPRLCADLTVEMQPEGGEMSDDKVTVGPPPVWALIERYEDHGTDVSNIVGLYSTETSAYRALAEENAKHNWLIDEEPADGWCTCHGQDWRVEGPWTVVP